MASQVLQESDSLGQNECALQFSDSLTVSFTPAEMFSIKSFVCKPRWDQHYLALMMEVLGKFCQHVSCGKSPKELPVFKIHTIGAWTCSCVFMCACQLVIWFSTFSSLVNNNKKRQVRQPSVLQYTLIMVWIMWISFVLTYLYISLICYKEGKKSLQ